MGGPTGGGRRPRPLLRHPGPTPGLSSSPPQASEAADSRTQAGFPEAGFQQGGARVWGGGGERGQAGGPGVRRTRGARRGHARGTKGSPGVGRGRGRRVGMGWGGPWTRRSLCLTLTQAPREGSSAPLAGPVQRNEVNSRCREGRGSPSKGVRAAWGVCSCVHAAGTLEEAWVCAHALGICMEVAVPTPACGSECQARVQEPLCSGWGAGSPGHGAPRANSASPWPPRRPQPVLLPLVAGHPASLCVQAARTPQTRPPFLPRGGFPSGWSLGLALGCSLRGSSWLRGSQAPPPQWTPRGPHTPGLPAPPT